MVLSIVQNCTNLVIYDAVADAPVTIYQNDFVTPIVGPEDGMTVSSSGTVSIFADQFGVAEWSGVFLVVAGNDTRAIVSKCNLDCCLAKKMDAYLSNDCQCVQCDKELEIMNKIYLLMVSAIASASVLNNPELTAALKKYNKAVELCNLGNCKCNC